MAANKPHRNAKAPSVIRKALLLSDADADLRDWIWRNWSQSGSVIRDGLRAELIRLGEIEAGEATSPGLAAPQERQPTLGVAQGKADRELPVPAPAAAVVPPTAREPPAAPDPFAGLDREQLEGMLRSVMEQRSKAAPAAAPTPEVIEPSVEASQTAAVQNPAARDPAAVQGSTRELLRSMVEGVG